MESCDYGFVGCQRLIRRHIPHDRCLLLPLTFAVGGVCVPILQGVLLQRCKKCLVCLFCLFIYLFIFLCEVKSVIYLFESYILLTKSRCMDHFKGATRYCVLTNKRSYTNNVITDGGSYWVRVALVGELGKLN